jgi:hypothetical protein
MNLPKKVGVIFLPKYGGLNPIKNKTFDPLPCAHLLLQLNSVQTIFNFEVISLHLGDLHPIKLKNKLHIPLKKDNGNLKCPFTRLIRDVEAASKFNVDYWIGLTSMSINKRDPLTPRNSFYEVFRIDNNPQSKKLAVLITSEQWEKHFSPPSL